jgi:hypothetical protein
LRGEGDLEHELIVPELIVRESAARP